MKIKILGDKNRFLKPVKGTEKSAAYDLYIQEDVVIEKGRQVVPLGFAVELDEYTAAEIHPRSGYASKGMEGYEIIGKRTFDISNVTSIANAKQGLIETGQFASLETARFDADVTFGLVDEDYRDEVGVIINNRDTKFLIKRGTRIAQMLIAPVIGVEIEYVDTLSETERNGGFGSTNI